MSESDPELRTVLVVDDEVSLRAVVAEVLSRAGYRVVEAENGNVAVKFCREALPDLVLMDIFMPEKEGLETIRELHRDYPDLPMVAMSGGGAYRQLDYLETARAFGARALLPKPFGSDELLAIVRETLSS